MAQSRGKAKSSKGKRAPARRAEMPKSPPFVPGKAQEPQTMATQQPASAKRGRKPVPQDETPADRFVRMAKQRVPRALKAVLAVGNLSGRGYQYSPEQAAKIERDLLTAVGEVKASLARAPRAKTASEYEI